MIHPITIANRQIGPGHPPWIVAEMSANHNRSFERAIKIVDAAAEAGADAIKIQAFSPDEMTMDDETVYPPWNRPLRHLYEEAALPWAWIPRLYDRAALHGLVFFASVFSPAGVRRLEDCCLVPCHKIASFELCDVPLLRAAGATGKPVILSTGMATEREIEAALAAIRKGPYVAKAKRLAEGWLDATIDYPELEEAIKTPVPPPQVALLHCVSAYPAPAATMRLRAIPAMQKRFGVPVGLSDHSVSGDSVPAAATALGACIIEKHLTLDDDRETLDAAFSLTPREFSQMESEVRLSHLASHRDDCDAVREEEPSLKVRRSLYVVQDVEKGEPFTPENLRCLRPAKGLAPEYYDRIVQRACAARDIQPVTPLEWEHVEEEEQCRTNDHDSTADGPRRHASGSGSGGTRRPEGTAADGNATDERTSAAIRCASAAKPTDGPRRPP